MTTPKGKGYRSLVVAGRRFKWRFRHRVVVVADVRGGRFVVKYSASDGFRVALPGPVTDSP